MMDASKGPPSRKGKDVPPETPVKAKFLLGRVMATNGVAAEMSDDPAFKAFVMKSVARHSMADWGELDAHDKKVNSDGLKHGERLMSSYTFRVSTKLWVITEWDRSVTTCLFPDEY
jgi:hypothetical protein